MQQAAGATVVTGAGRGIGRGIARPLAADGHLVINLDRLPPDAAAAAEGAWVEVEVGDPDATREALAGVTARHPFVSGRGRRLLALERLIQKLIARGARFVTLEQAAREFDAQEPFPGQ